MAKIRGSVHISSASPSLTKVFKLAGIEKLATIDDVDKKERKI